MAALVVVLAAVPGLARRGLHLLLARSGHVMSKLLQRVLDLTKFYPCSLLGTAEVEFFTQNKSSGDRSGTSFDQLRMLSKSSG